MTSEIELRRRFFSSCFSGLERSGIRYAIVGVVDGFPDQFFSDVDFVVERAGLPETLKALISSAVDGWQLVQVLRHEVDAYYFIYCLELNQRRIWMELDVTSDYRRRGKLWMRAEDLVANRRPHSGGFWVPGPADGFRYYLIKKLDKGGIDARQATHLRELISEDPKGCAEVAMSLIGMDGWEALKKGLAAEGPSGMETAELTGELRRRAAPEGWIARSWMQLREMGRVLGRILRPTGLTVAVLGPDGVGKSTIIAALQRELQPAFRRIDYRHLRPRVLRAGNSRPADVSNPHGTVERGWVASVAKLGLFVADSLIGFLVSIWGLKMQSSLVIFDRYPHDMLADPRRYGLSTPRWFNELVLSLVPKPDLWLILDAPVDVILERKQEITAESCARVREGYIALSRRLAAAKLVETSGGVDETVSRACDAVVEVLNRRTQRRFRQ